MRRMFNLWAVGLLILSSACSDTGKQAAMEIPDGSNSGAFLDVRDDFEWEMDLSEDLLDDMVPDAFIEDILPHPEMAPILAQSFQNLLNEYTALTGDTGAAMAVHTGDGAWWEGASGLCDPVTGSIMEPDMGFRVGSNTKPFVATLVLMLWEEGLLDLDDSIALYLPQYPQWESVTIRQLLGMNAGIPDYLGNSEFIFTAMMDPDQLDDHAALVAYVENLPFLFPPGEGCVYSNTNYVLAGMIIEEVTGNFVESELNDKIIAPLGLEHTFLDVEGGTIEGLSHGFMDLALVSYLFGVPLEALSFIPDEWFIEGMVVDATYIFPPSVSWSAGALVSTPRDMATFMRALLRGELLGPEALTEMKTTVDCKLVTGDLGYGLGLQVHETAVGMLYGHGGLNFGYQAMTLYYDELDVAFSHMHNYLPEQGEIIHATILPWISDGLDEVYVPCLPPEDFFAGEGPELQVRFGGPLNMDGFPNPIAGVGSVKQVTPEDIIPLYGFGTTAKRQFQDDTFRVVVESVGPVADESDAVLRVASLTMTSEALTNGDGLFDVASLPAWSLFVTVADLFISEGATDVDRLCYTGVSQFNNPGRVFFCVDDEFEAKLGDTIKIYGEFPLETDIAALDSLFQNLGSSRCICKGDSNEWLPCVDN